MWHKVDSGHVLKVELRRFSIELDTVRRQDSGMILSFLVSGTVRMVLTMNEEEAMGRVGFRGKIRNCFVTLV